MSCRLHGRWVTLASMLNPASTSRSEATLSVSSLNRLARSLLESNFPAVAVEGEISNLAQPSSGHWYLTLKDKNAQLRCAMFRNRNQLLRFRPRNGLQVIARGRLSIYEGRGDYQLIVDSLEEAGDGALRRAFEQLKIKLQDEGLFAAESKQAIGQDFRHIGLITSRTGAAVRDMITVFRRRFPAIRLTLFPVAVQGNEAAAEIVRAIETANDIGRKLGVEALIVGRGGGSLEDLQAFNEESVARAIYASELPITSAVGHEVDFTIADFVADLRAPTPSAAAELMSPNQEDYYSQIEAFRQQLAQRHASTLRSLGQTLSFLQRRLQRPDRRLQDHAQTLDRLETALLRAINKQLQHRAGAVQQQRRNLLLSSPQARLRHYQHELVGQTRRYRQAMQSLLSSSNAKLMELGRGLNAVNPLQVLARGYSITFTDTDRILRSGAGVTPGQVIHTRLADGSVKSVVESVSASSPAGSQAQALSEPPSPSAKARD